MPKRPGRLPSWIRRTITILALAGGCLIAGTIASWAQSDACVKDGGHQSVDVGDTQVNVDTPVAVNCKGANNKDRKNRASGSTTKQVNVYQPVAVNSSNSNNGSQYNSAQSKKEAKKEEALFFAADGNMDPRIQAAYALANASQINVYGGGVAVASQDSNNGGQYNYASSAAQAQNTDQTTQSGDQNWKLISQAALASARTLQLNFSGEGLEAASENSNQGTQENQTASSTAAARNINQTEQQSSGEGTYAAGNLSYAAQTAQADAHTCQVSANQAGLTENCLNDQSTEEAASSSHTQQSGGDGLVVGNVACTVQNNPSNTNSTEQEGPGSNVNCTQQTATSDEDASNSNYTDQDNGSGTTMGNWNSTSQTAQSVNEFCVQSFSGSGTGSQNCQQQTGDIDQEATNKNWTEQENGSATYGAGNWNYTDQDARTDAQNCTQQGMDTSNATQTCTQRAGDIDQDATNSNHTRQDDGTGSTSGNWNETDQNAEANAQTCDQNISGEAVGVQTCNQRAGDIEQEVSNSNSTKQTDGTAESGANNAASGYGLYGGEQAGNWNSTNQNAEANAQTCSQFGSGGEADQTCVQRAGNIDQDVRNSNRTEQENGSAESSGAYGDSVDQSGNSNSTNQTADANAQTCSQTVSGSEGWDQACVQQARDVNQNVKNSNSTEQEDGTATYDVAAGPCVATNGCDGGDVSQSGNENSSEQTARANAQTCSQDANFGAEAGQICVQEARGVDQSASNSNRTDQDDGRASYAEGWGSTVNQNGNSNSSEQTAETTAQSCAQEGKGAEANQDCIQQAGDINQRARNSNSAEQENGSVFYGQGYGTTVNQTGNNNSSTQSSEARARSCTQDVSKSEGWDQLCVQQGRDVNQSASNSNRADQEGGRATYEQGWGSTTNQTGNRNLNEQDASANAGVCSQDVSNGAEAGQICVQQGRDVNQRASNSNAGEQERGRARYGEGYGSTVNQTGNWSSSEQSSEANALTCSQFGTADFEGEGEADQLCVQQSRDVNQRASNSNRTDQDDGAVFYGEGWGTDVNQTGNWNNAEQDAATNAQTCSQDVEGSEGWDQICVQGSRDINQRASNSNWTEQENGRATYQASNVCSAGKVCGGGSSVDQTGNWNSSSQTASSDAQTCDQAVTGGAEAGQVCVQGARDVNQRASNSNSTEQENGRVTYGQGWGSQVRQTGNYNETSQGAETAAQRCAQFGAGANEEGEADQTCVQGSRDVNQKASNSNSTEQENGRAIYGQGWGNTVDQTGNYNDTEQTATATAQECSQDVSGSEGWDQICVQGSRDIDQRASNSNSTEQENGRVTYDQGWGTTVNQTGNYNDTGQAATATAQSCSQEVQDAEAAQTCVQRSRDINQRSSNSNRTEQENGRAVYGSGWGSTVNQTGNRNTTTQVAQNQAQVCDQEAAGSVCVQSARDIDSNSANSNSTEQENGRAVYGSGWGTTVNQTGNSNDTTQVAVNQTQICSGEDAHVCVQTARDIRSNARNSNSTEQEEGRAVYSEGMGNTVNQTGNRNTTTQVATNRTQICSQGDMSACAQFARDVNSEAKNSNETEQEEGTGAVVYADGGTGGGTQTGNSNATTQVATDQTQQCGQGDNSSCTQIARDVHIQVRNKNETEQEEGTAYGDSSGTQTGNSNNSVQVAVVSAHNCIQGDNSTCTQQVRDVNIVAVNSNHTEQEEGLAVTDGMASDSNSETSTQAISVQFGNCASGTGSSCNQNSGNVQVLAANIYSFGDDDD